MSDYGVFKVTFTFKQSYATPKEECWIETCVAVKAYNQFEAMNLAWSKVSGATYDTLPEPIEFRAERQGK